MLACGMNILHSTKPNQSNHLSVNTAKHDQALLKESIFLCMNQSIESSSSAMTMSINFKLSDLTPKQNDFTI
jgi:hypothetical protein